MTQFLDSFSIAECVGLSPRMWLCVGTGFSREEIKDHLLRSGAAFVGETLTNLESLALRITSIESDRVLSASGRQEAFRFLLSNREILARVPELKRLKRQSQFFKKLDRAIQSGRLSFAHGEEENVHLQRLEEKIGLNPIRDEVRLVTLAYETWMAASNLWDLPALLRRSCEILAGEGPEFRLPEKIIYFSTQAPESLEQQFWDLLSRWTTVDRQGPWLVETEATERIALSWSWEKWHTLDDAAESLVERILESVGEEPSKLAEHAILMPDAPAVRRSLKRALEDHAIPLADPRDPVRARVEEGIKFAMAPLEAVGSQFERRKVISLLRRIGRPEKTTDWIREINSRGIRQGLSGYAGGKLSDLHVVLAEFSERFGSRKKCTELAKQHLAWLEESEELRQWVHPFFENLWKGLVEDLQRTSQAHRRAPPLYWLERLRTRVQEASPPVERVRPAQGLQLYRLSQAPLALRGGTLWVFGLPSSWLSGDGNGDYWYSDREREALATEFAVRSGSQQRKERWAVLRSWFRNAADKQVPVVFLDAHYDWDGRERESLVPLFRELDLIRDEEVSAVEKGAHPRWLPSFGALRPVQPQNVVLTSIQRTEFQASELDRYSRCSFQALGAYRWRLRDQREPEADLWGDVRGNILHAAIRRILEQWKDPEHRPDRETVLAALEEAWFEARPKGLFKSPRLERYIKERLVKILDVFCDKELDFLKRAGTRIASLEGPPLKVELDQCQVVGIPDRIDEHPDGLFVMDYKTSSGLPNGNVIVDAGYRLQLPFYALAARQHFGKTVLGAQFIELDRRGGRSHGIFFKQWNGKNAGCLTNTRSRSVLDQEPETTWGICERQLREQLQAYRNGRFEARPRDKSECRSCAYSDLCGKKRTTEEPA